MTAAATVKKKPRKRRSDPTALLLSYQRYMHGRETDRVKVNAEHLAETRAEEVRRRREINEARAVPKKAPRPTVVHDHDGDMVANCEGVLLHELGILDSQRSRRVLNVHPTDRARIRLLKLLANGGNPSRLRRFTYENGELGWKAARLSSRASECLHHLSSGPKPPPADNGSLEPCGPKMSAHEQWIESKREDERLAGEAAEIKVAVQDGQQPATVFIPPIDVPEP